MSDCCSFKSASSRKHPCPVNGTECSEVASTTILHHLKDPSAWAGKIQKYYFCEDPACDVVYFGADGSVISQSEIRTAIGIKNDAPDALICYCFGISKRDALADPSRKEFVIQKTRSGLCSCETSNPSGRCCLKDFPHREA